MPDSSDITDQIAETAANGVQSASEDGRSVQAVPIADLIAAEKHVAQKESLSSGGSMWGKLRPARFIAGGPQS